MIRFLRSFGLTSRLKAIGKLWRHYHDEEWKKQDLIWWNVTLPRQDAINRDLENRKMNRLADEIAGRVADRIGAEWRCHRN